MHADKQPFPLQIADVGYCRYFLRTRQLNSPFASIRPPPSGVSSSLKRSGSCVSSNCPNGQRHTRHCQIPLLINSTFVLISREGRSARKSGSVRTPIYGVLFERGNKELSLLDIAPHLPIYQAKERDFQHLPSPEGGRWKGNWG